MGAAGSNNNDVSDFNAAKIQPISEVVRLMELEAERVSEEFWKAHAVVNRADGSWPCLPGWMPDAGDDPDTAVYNNKIRPPSTWPGDGAEVAEPRRSRRGSWAKVAAHKCRLEIVARKTDGKAAPVARSPTVRSLGSAGNWTTSSSLSAIDENSPSTESLVSGASSLRSTASSTAAWSEVASPAIHCAGAESQKVPPSGLWSGAVVAGSTVCAISRELVFHQNGDISGVSLDADISAFINGSLQPGTGSASWTELLPSGKNKFRGKVHMEAGRVLIRGSVMKSGRSVGHFELSFVTKRQRGQRR